MKQMNWLEGLMESLQKNSGHQLYIYTKLYHSQSLQHTILQQTFAWLHLYAME